LPLNKRLVRFSAAGFPIRHGGGCRRWIVHNAFMQPGVVKVQVTELPDSAVYLCLPQLIDQQIAVAHSPSLCDTGQSVPQCQQLPNERPHLFRASLLPDRPQQQRQFRGDDREQIVRARSAAEALFTPKPETTE
jgi:hypothetical protein